jgi:tryptophanyl-tRNA synthetase
MSEQEHKKILFSGMQPTGIITIGNYFGALKNWVKLHEDYNCLFCVVDMHSITIRQDPAKLRKSSRELLALYIAAGLDPKDNIIYYQSHVPQHAELSWILSCFTYMGELNRMTQFKEKSQKSELNLNAGLYTYPILMAADILLYKTDVVPVGNDQKQHLELARDIAARFNSAYSDTFTVPEPYIAEMGARIASLQEPTKKMSKSDENPNAYISLLDEPNVIRKKIKRAVTDSDAVIAYTEEKAGIRNLIDIYCLSTGKSKEEALAHFEGKGYGDLKEEVADALINELEPIQKRFKELLEDKEYLDTIIKENAQKAIYLANKTLAKVKKKVGFPQ